MPSINDHDMEHLLAPSPPLPPDPTQHTLRKVQPFQEQYAPQKSPQMQAQQQTQQLQQSQPMFESKSANTGRSRAGSRAPPVLHQPQPIKDAVHNAFESSPVVQNELDPELVRKVTEQVIRNLQQQTANMPTPIASAQPQQTQYAAPPLPQPIQPAARSPTQSSTDSIPQRYTPPSPEKRGWGEENGHDSPENEVTYSDTGSAYSRESRNSMASNRNRETPRPLHSEGAARLRRSNTTGRRHEEHGSDDERPRRRDSGSRAIAREPSRPIRKDSKDSEASYHQTTSQVRGGRQRVPSDAADPDETTTLEKIWKPLFDNGNPTVRLGQFLRGLAIHLIDDYEPKGSLVVTPPKMMRFFDETKVLDEHYPWETVFNRMTSNSLSTMYRKLLCQHHLVQGQYHEPPSVPGLTPVGFEGFMSCLIQAHPDTEYERLSHAVMNMPISNADDSKERFPKELSRRLLPSRPNMQAEQRLVASLNHEPQVQLRGASNMPPPPPASAPPQQFSSFNERERKPYSQTPASNAIDDEDLGPPSMPIERERKPYSAKEGMGKTYKESETQNQRDREPSRPSTSQFRGEMPIPHRRNSRSNSGLPPQSFYSNGNGEPVNAQSQSSRHRTSNPPGPPPAMTNNGPPIKRRATPPLRNPFARSEPMEVGSLPSSQYASNLQSGGSRDHYAGDPDDDTLRRHHNRRPTERSSNTNGNSGDDDSGAGRGYPIPPRQPPSTQAFDSGYIGSAGGPPVGSYPRGGFTADARRQTWYGATPGMAGAGSDGYGSFAGNGNGYGGQQYGSSGQH